VYLPYRYTDRAGPDTTLPAPRRRSNDADVYTCILDCGADRAAKVLSASVDRITADAHGADTTERGPDSLTRRRRQAAPRLDLFVSVSPCTTPAPRPPPPASDVSSILYRHRSHPCAMESCDIWSSVVYIYIYIYIYRERERETRRYMTY